MSLKALFLPKELNILCVSKRMVSLKQGKHSVTDYTLEFFHHPGGQWLKMIRLSETLKDHLAPLDLPSDLEAVIRLASKDR